MSAYYQPVPFLVIATSRSGGTFLTHCLDSHPQISCERDSPLDPASYWREWLSFEGIGSVNEADLLHALWCRSGYHVAGFKLSYRQARRVGLEWLATSVNGKVIHLYRASPVRTVLSSCINTAVQQGGLRHPVHTYETVMEPARITVDAGWFLSECHRYVENVDAMMASLTETCDGSWLSLSYDIIVGGEGNEAERMPEAVAWALCSWLGVERQSLTSGLRRVNPQSLSEIVENWPALRDAIIADATFVEFLEEN